MENPGTEVVGVIPDNSASCIINGAGFIPIISTISLNLTHPLQGGNLGNDTDIRSVFEVVEENMTSFR